MTPDKHKKIVTSLSNSLLVISMFLCAFFFLTYIIEPDFCAALTFWPVWIWAIPGIILSLKASGVNKKLRLAVTSVWILLVIFEAEEPLALLRSCLYFNRDCKNSCSSGNCLRIISLNCALANPNAVEEIVQYSPDIVLIQESPSAKDLETLTQKLFAGKGEFLLGCDTAILARGRVIKTDFCKEFPLFMTSARVYLLSGLEIETISVHLSPPAAAVNLLSRACWQEHCEDKHHRLKEITSIKKCLEPIGQNTPLVVGGDFNAKPWRGEIKVFSPRLHDSFRKAGLGWPGTGPAHFPLWRVDQIWISNHFKPIKVWGQRCKNSDHRMVICDLCAL
jgi:endonuclease/exonuclease/phosphatase (EEP) superfamily protein YafD